MGDDSQLRLQVVYATPERQCLIEIDVSCGTTCDEAVRLSGIGREFPADNLGSLPIAVWGNVVSRNRHVEDGDRLEILRSLEIDPRDARRDLATEGQFMGGAGLKKPDV